MLTLVDLSAALGYNTLFTILGIIGVVIAKPNTQKGWVPFAIGLVGQLVNDIYGGGPAGDQITYYTCIVVTILLAIGFGVLINRKIKTGSIKPAGTRPVTPKDKSPLVVEETVSSGHDEETWVCSFCGNVNSPKNKFCTNCGNERGLYHSEPEDENRSSQDSSSKEAIEKAFVQKSADIEKESIPQESNNEVSEKQSTTSAPVEEKVAAVASLNYRYCRKCGRKIPADSNYCNWCGEPTVYIDEL